MQSMLDCNSLNIDKTFHKAINRNLSMVNALEGSKICRLNVPNSILKLTFKRGTPLHVYISALNLSKKP